MDHFLGNIEHIKNQRDFTKLVDEIPYAQTLGIKILDTQQGIVFCLPAQESVVGNPTLPAIHGGAISGFMEVSAAMFLLLKFERPVIPRVVDFSIDFLRAGRLFDTYASCEILRQGNRVTNVQVRAWQQEEHKPIATARANFITEPH